MPPHLTFHLLTTAVAMCLAATATAGESLFVTCDNGLRCVRAPCPSWDTVALPSGERFARTPMDFGALNGKDKTRLHRDDRLYHGKLVLAGTVERRSVTSGGLQTSRTIIRASRIVRPATAQETALCLKR